MDRNDEKRDDRTDDRTDNTYNPLGIADANPPRDRVPSEGERAHEDVDDEGVGTAGGVGSRAGSREIQRSPGATGIDMGAGGTGTEIERD
jgi:hypothetical protein